MTHSAQRSSCRCCRLSPADRRLPTPNVQVEADIGSPADILEPAVDPRFHVGPSVADIPTDSEPRWSFSPIPPGVDRGDGHSKIVDEFFDGEQPVERFHSRILGSDPFNRMSFTLSVTLQLHSNTRVGRLEAGF